MPRTGPCNPWVNGDDVAAFPPVQAALAKLKSPPSPDVIASICAECASAATNMLFELSGKVFTGPCGPVTIRPVARPSDVDSRGWFARLGWASGSASWGSCSSNLGVGGIASHFGCSSPPEIQFGVYPVNTIESVYIDGVLIPPSEYELRDSKTLVRLRPTAGFSPTERWGWPTCQIEDLPPTQPGTFSVTFTYGQDPGPGGRLAAKKLAEVLALPQFGDTTQYPRRVTSFSRQGVSAVVADVMDVLKSRASGIYEVDVWLLSVNPKKNRRQARVWSPDMGRNRRVPTVTN